MATDTKLPQLKINVLSEEQYKTATLQENELYLLNDVNLYSSGLTIDFNDLGTYHNEVITKDRQVLYINTVNVSKLTIQVNSSAAKTVFENNTAMSHKWEVPEGEENDWKFVEGSLITWEIAKIEENKPSAIGIRFDIVQP